MDIPATKALHPGTGAPAGGSHEPLRPQQNLKHLRAVLTRTTDEGECRRIVGLIEEEEAAGRKSPGPAIHYAKIRN
jgi:hypothetical protein